MERGKVQHTQTHTLLLLPASSSSHPPPLLPGRSSGLEGVLPSGPDISQFKQGVKTVAGKMAVLANGVMNTIQVRLAQVSTCSCAGSALTLLLSLQDRYGSY